MTELKLLGISGSPRDGNSLFLLKRAVEAAKSVKLCHLNANHYSFRGKRFAPCVHCARCTDLNGECVQEDDFQGLQNLWLKADVVLYSVPVYHMGIPGQLKCFLDRLGQCFFARTSSEILPLKVIGLMAQGMFSYCGQEPTLTSLIHHALIMGAIPVTVDRTIGVGMMGVGAWTRKEKDRHALARHYKEKEMETETVVMAAENLARRAVELAVALRLGIAAAKEEAIRVKYPPSLSGNILPFDPS